MTRTPTSVIGIVVGLVAVISLGGCTSDSNDSDSDSNDTIVAATVRVRADGCGPRTELGTGTLIDDTLVVTAAHVVAGSDHVEVVGHAGEPVSAVVVWFDPDLDVAALRTDETLDPPRPAPLRTEPGESGERGVVALVDDDGTVELRDVGILQRVTIETTDIYREHSVERLGLRIDTNIEPGDSGAMVHLGDGGVGIVWSRSTATEGQAWTVDLPQVLLDPASRRTVVEPVDTGSCT